MGLDTLVDEQNVGGRDRIARAVLAVTFAIAAIRALRTGRRTRTLVAAGIAVGFAFNTVTCFCGANRLLGVDTSAE